MTKEDPEKGRQNSEKEPEPSEANGDLIDTDETDDLDAGLRRAVDSAPPAMRRTFMSMMRSGPLIHPIFEKFKSEHVDKFLDYMHDDDMNDYKLAQSEGNRNLIYFFGIIAFLVFLFWTFGESDKALLTEIIRMLILIAGGFGGGYGWRATQEKRK